MLREMLKSKIYKATVTDANLKYEGSITIDRDLMDAAGFIAYEKVLVADLTNGARLETYIIEGKAGSGIICINGAAAHHIKVSDQVIIMSFALVDENEISSFEPRKIIVDSKNKVKA